MVRKATSPWHITFDQLKENDDSMKSSAALNYDRNLIIKPIAITHTEAGFRHFLVRNSNAPTTEEFELVLLSSEEGDDMIAAKYGQYHSDWREIEVYEVAKQPVHTGTIPAKYLRKFYLGRPKKA